MAGGVLDDLHHDQESENDKKIDLALKNYFGDSIKGLRVAKIESLIDSRARSLTILFRFSEFDDILQDLR